MPGPLSTAGNFSSIGTIVAASLFALWNRGISLSRFLRLRPFDVTTPEGRADERHRRVVLSAVASALARVLSIGTALITVPLTLHLLGRERYGVWMTISSFVGLLVFADFGIGNGLMNTVADAHGKDDRNAIRSAISSSVFLLGIVAIAVMALFATAYSYMSWSAIFNVSSSLAKQECAPATAAFVICFALAMPTGIVQRVQMGLQQSFAASLWQCAASVFGLIAVIAAIAFHASLPWLVIALMGAPLLANLLNTLTYFVWVQPDIAPSVQSVSRDGIRIVGETGFLFFLIQFIGAALFASDNIVIAQILGAAAVTAYAVPQRLFSLISTIFGLALTPLWPAYGEAISRGDHLWVWRTLRRSFMIAAGISAPLALVLILSGNWVIALWVGHGIGASLLLLAGLGLWQVAQTVGNTITMYLNGANMMRFQLIWSAVAACVGLTAKILLVPVIGVSGVVWATVLSYVLCVGVPTFFFIRRRMVGAG